MDNIVRGNTKREEFILSIDSPCLLFSRDGMIAIYKRKIIEEIGDNGKLMK